jgi:phospholipid/cholesterol/gamma-HCH transport system permease protein
MTPVKTTGGTWTVAVDGSTASVALSGDWVARRDGVHPGAVAKIMLPGVQCVAFDSAKLGRWDSGLIAFLIALRQAAHRTGADFRDEGLPTPAQRLLKLVADPAPAPPAASTPFLDRAGLWAITLWREGVEAVALSGDVLLRGSAALRGRSSLRSNDLVTEMFDAGLAALPIITLVSALVGGILAFIGATELRKLGAGSYVANLVAIGMVREMAAMMTAIIMAGRTGGAYAATIAAMQVAEEIDALRAMGVTVFDYLLLPRMLALTAMMPILYLYSCVIGMLGGLCVGAATLDAAPVSFFLQAQRALNAAELAIGLSKSLCFGGFIAIVACRVGLHAERSAAAVGKAATTAVVVGIVGVIALDALFDLCASVLGV